MSLEPKFPAESGSVPSTEGKRADAPGTEGIGASSPSSHTSSPVSASDGTSDGGAARTDTGSLDDSSHAGDTTQPEAGSSDWDKLPAPVFEVDRVVFGKYRLLEKIGEGGMGSVWKVHNVELDRASALKLIKPEIAQNDKGWTRFQREARLMAKLNHPNAVAVYDFKRTQSMGYIEMEFVRGRSLEQILKEQGERPLPLDWIVQIVDQLCSVLKDAHSHEDEKTGKPKPIIHRDLKPSNLMLVDRKQDQTREIQLKVLDFGIAKMAEDDGNPELTGAHDIIGTPSYMSPEQIKGGIGREGEEREIDGRSDLYSTGVVLYHLLTGSLPFRGNKMAMMAAHLHNKPLPMNEANPQAAVPPGVEQVVMQCLEKEPDKRPQSAAELAEKFRQAAGITAGRGAAGPSRPLPWGKVAAAAVVLALVAGALVPLVGMFGKSPAGSEKARASNETAPVVTAGSAPANNPPAPSPTKAWMPKGFAAPVSKSVDDGSGLPIQLKRDDGALFAYHRDGMYLPVGYKPEDSESTAGQWPKAIVRQSDKTRFIRIDGGTFLRGDPRRDQSPSSDVAGNPLTPHYVRVRGFYIQETEVTNGEIQQYLDAHPDDQKNLRNWRDSYESFRKDNQIDDAQMSHYPAVCIGYDLATRYAAWAGGLLPTEAEWEYAAKSRNDDYLFAWGKELPASGERPANLDHPQTVSTPVKTFPKDKTDQGVYDTTGNVRELCADAYLPYDDLKLTANSHDQPLIDRRESLLESSQAGQVKVVVRGGSYLDKARKALTFMRDRLPMNDNVPGDVGFRVVIECPSQADDSGDEHP